MPIPVSYEGYEIGTVVIGRPGPNQGGKTTHWCRCRTCNTEFLRRRSVIQQALKHGRHLCKDCKVKRPRSSRKSYEGTEIGCALVQEDGADIGRRTTHWCVCRATNQRFLRTKNAIQQAIKWNKAICPFCKQPAQEHPTRDLVGMKFGLITVSSFACRRGQNARSSEDYWVCICECDPGNKFQVAGRSLLRGRTRSCGCLSAPNLTGQQFGRLTVIAPGSTRADGQRSWKCRCSCPRQTVVERTTAQLRGKRASRDCGCVQSEQMTDRWAQKRRTVQEIAQYRIFLSFKNSAKRRKVSITLTLAEVADLTSHPCFYCGALPAQVLKVPVTSRRGAGGTRYIGTHLYSSIDRIDNSRGYEPGNTIPSCRMCQIAKGSQSCSEFAAWIERLHSRLQELRARFLHDGDSLSD